MINPFKHLGPTFYYSSNTNDPITIKHANSSVNFTNSTKPNFHFNANNISFFSDTAYLQTDALSCSTLDTLSLQSENPILIACEEIKIESQQHSININANAIVINSQRVSLETPEITQPCQIACKNDMHQCPASTGSQPHIGGYLAEGSSNVFIDGASVARHNDVGYCGNLTNPIMTQLTSITVNNQPVAHTRALMGHGGRIMSGQEMIRITPSKNRRAHTKNTYLNTSNRLQLHIQNFNTHAAEKRTIELTNTQSIHIDETQSNYVSFINLTSTELTSLMTITIR